jgi:hypothetical protein
LEVFTGGSYRTGPKGRVFFDNNLLKTQFNTVEGFNANMGFGYVHRFDSLRRAITVRSDLRYGLASNQFYGTGTLRYSRRGNRTRPTFVAELRGGSYVEQFSTQFNSIEPVINTFSSLLYRQNFLKIYEKQFGLLNLRWNKGERWRVQSTLEYAQRNPLQNNTDFSIYNRGDRAYTSNDPLNLHGDTAFDPHQALISTVKASYKPFSTFYMRNGRRYESFARSPEIRMMYRKGFEGVLGADAAFDHLELGLAHDFQLGIRGRIDFQVKAGSFFGSDPAYFMDFAHFAGNRTSLTSLNPAGAYRLLDFYLYSTSGEYLSFLGHYQFRKFLFTQLPRLRVSGLRENVFLNYLKTDVSPHYVEVGYGVDNIFRLFRVEFATSFEDLKYQEFGYRIGVATIININRE